MHLENLLATTNVRQPYDNLAVETTRTQQSRIKHVRTVGSCDNNNAVVHLEAVHLNQQLVQCLLALIVTTTKAGTTVTTYCIDLVDENNTGSLFFGLIKHVAYTRRTHTYKHLDKIRTRDGEEWHFGLTGDGFCQQCLTGTRLTDHQNASRNAATQALEFVGFAQEVDQFLYVFLGLFNTSHIRECHFDLVFTQQFGLALAE